MRIALGGLIVLSCMSCANAQQSAPQPFTRPDYSDNRSSAVDVIRSYYNAINLSQYARAYSYKLRGTPELDANALAADYAKFRDGFSDTAHVWLKLGFVTSDTAMSTTHYAVPVVIETLSDSGTRQAYAGCYDVVRVSAGVQDFVPFDPIRIAGGTLHKINGDMASAAMPKCPI
ncbi:hypothetical protein AB4874_02400 [Thioclava sp. 15-R06ZXC-3]|uniref:DUF3828 domain-containing protein n=1 Tax=Thioclava arctica TaxID=3238301 RepID=A0ABV3TFW7_9RHOB